MAGEVPGGRWCSHCCNCRGWFLVRETGRHGIIRTDGVSLSQAVGRHRPTPPSSSPAQVPLRPPVPASSRRRCCRHPIDCAFVISLLTAAVNTAVAGRFSDDSDDSDGGYGGGLEPAREEEWRPRPRPSLGESPGTPVYNVAACQLSHSSQAEMDLGGGLGLGGAELLR